MSFNGCTCWYRQCRIYARDTKYLILLIRWRARFPRTGNTLYPESAGDPTATTKNCLSIRFQERFDGERKEAEICRSCTRATAGSPEHLYFSRDARRIHHAVIGIQSIKYSEEINIQILSSSSRERLALGGDERGSHRIHGFVPEVSTT